MADKIAMEVAIDLFKSIHNSLPVSLENPLHNRFVSFLTTPATVEGGEEIVVLAEEILNEYK